MSKPQLKKILLVDDDSATNFINEITIKKTGVDAQIVVCTSAFQALDYLGSTGQYENQERFPQPCIIFLDINMPGMNGFEFLDHYDKLPEEQKGILVVVMLTTSVNPDDRMRSENDQNIKGFISKPLTEEHLMKIINDNFEWSKK
ncbi:response regulator [Flavobacterium stagni]|uniref:Response regulator n=1 Tax=Flavobacterium stagni TaxID=2506421 RepID=A0A4Q1K7W6_9FLAO|nr:response regulator [Flavobacterium stagni]RXR21669.1 response regulator [Flavobacterium stagni]